MRSNLVHSECRVLLSNKAVGNKEKLNERRGIVASQGKVEPIAQYGAGDGIGLGQSKKSAASYSVGGVSGDIESFSTMVLMFTRVFFSSRLVILMP